MSIIRLQRDHKGWDDLPLVGNVRRGLLMMSRVSPVCQYAVQKPHYKPWFWLIPEVEEWLFERGAEYRLLFRRTRKGVYGHWCIEVPDELALMFRLTWGGQ